jgi:tRNA threonylcarbamoyladenosine biosynthesis protein TsaB
MLLAIDTSTKVFSISLAELQSEQCKILSEIYFDIGLKHSELILKYVDLLLKETKIELSNITKVACTIGPGSFTGVRIGLTFSRTLCQMLKIPLVGISTLDVLAANLTTDNPVCAMIDALQEEVYCAFYKNNKRAGDYKLIKISDLANDINNQSKSYKKLVVIGDAVNIYKNKINELVNKNKIEIVYPGEQFMTPKSSVLATIAFNMPGRKYDRINPFYIKPPKIN